MKIVKIVGTLTVTMQVRDAKEDAPEAQAAPAVPTAPTAPIVPAVPAVPTVPTVPTAPAAQGAPAIRSIDDIDAKTFFSEEAEDPVGAPPVENPIPAASPATTLPSCSGCDARDYDLLELRRKVDELEREAAHWHKESITNESEIKWRMQENTTLRELLKNADEKVAALETANGSNKP